MKIKKKIGGGGVWGWRNQELKFFGKFKKKIGGGGGGGGWVHGGGPKGGGVGGGGGGVRMDVYEELKSFWENSHKKI